MLSCVIKNSHFDTKHPFSLVNRNEQYGMKTWYIIGAKFSSKWLVKLCASNIIVVNGESWLLLLSVTGSSMVYQVQNSLSVSGLTVNLMLGINSMWCDSVCEIQCKCVWLQIHVMMPFYTPSCALWSVPLVFFVLSKCTKFKDALPLCRKIHLSCNDTHLYLYHSLTLAKTY